MRIVQLTAENLKRLRAVDITPDGHLQVIAGRNGQGKTSVLDAIWFALGGKDAQRGTAKPIREGQATASVRLDLGDIVVTRTWAGDRTALKVESKDGARYGSPQAMLDDIVGRLSFDPLAFTHLPAREQRDTLLTLVDLPFDPADLDRRRAGLFEQRTEIGREGKQLEGQLAGTPVAPDGTPDVEVSSADLFTELRAAQNARSEHAMVVARAEDAQSARERAEDAMAAAERALIEAQAAEAAAITAVRALPDLPDTAALEGRIAGVDDVNAAVRAKAQGARVAAAVADARVRYEEKSTAIAALDQEKADGLAAAVFPIDGLSFDADGVTYQGVPFTQASAAEQLRVSLALAMAMNPKLRVIRITDGSLLDADNMALIEEMAKAQDYQVWIERVDETGSIGILIEDGAVAETASRAS